MLKIAEFDPVANAELLPFEPALVPDKEKTLPYPFELSVWVLLIEVDADSELTSGTLVTTEQEFVPDCDTVWLTEVAEHSTDVTTVADADPQRKANAASPIRDFIWLVSCLPQ